MASMIKVETIAITDVNSQPPITTVIMLVPIMAEVMSPTWALVSPKSSLMNGYKTGMLCITMPSANIAMVARATTHQW